jgi:hypothetical protein
MAQDNNVDKGLYEAPKGMEELAQNEPELEIEIVDPDEVNISVDGMEINIDPDRMEDDEFNLNLAEEMEDDLLGELADDLIEDYTGDVNSRKDWLDTYVDGLDLLGLKTRRQK